MSLVERFEGTGVAVVTPFKQGNIDFVALEKIIEHIIRGRCEYLVVLGTTGESVTLSTEEKLKVIACFVKVNNNRLPLMLGIGGNNTREVLNMLHSTPLNGFSAILSVSPYYNKPNQEGIYKHFMAIADNSPLPVLLYNVPSRSGSNITAETTLRLAQHKNIFGIKEASGNFDQCMEILNNKSDEFMVISGDDPYTLPYIALGMNGVISVVANAYPEEFSTMVRHALKGDFDSARPMHYRLLNTIKNMFADGSPGGVKNYLNLMGLCAPEVREPLDVPGEPTLAKIKSDFELKKQK